MKQLARLPAFGASFILCILGIPPPDLFGENGDQAWFNLSALEKNRIVTVTVSIDFQEGIDIEGWSLGISHDPKKAKLLSFNRSKKLSDLLSQHDESSEYFYLCQEAVDPNSPGRIGIVQVVIVALYEMMSLPKTGGGFPVLELEYLVLEETSIQVASGLQGKAEPVSAIITFDSKSFTPSSFPSKTLLPKTYDTWFTISPSLSEGPVTVSIHHGDVGIQGWSFGLCHDQAGIWIFRFDPGEELATIQNGGPPEYYFCEKDSDLPLITQSVLLSQDMSTVLPPSPEGFPVLEVEYKVIEESAVMICEGRDESGAPVPASLTVENWPYYPQPLPVAHMVPKSSEAWYVLSPPTSNSQLTVSIEFKHSDLQAWSFGLCHDPAAASVESWLIPEELMAINDGGPPDWYFCDEVSQPPMAGIIQAAVICLDQYCLLPEREGGFPVLHVNYRVQEESSVSICDGLQGKGLPVSSYFTIFEKTHPPSRLATAKLIQKPYSAKLSYKAEPPESGEVVTVKLYSSEIEVEGWSFALCNTARAAEAVEIITSPAVEEILDGEPPEYLMNEITPADPFVAVRQSVLLGSPLKPVARGPFPDGLPLLAIRYRVLEGDSLKFCDVVGNLAFDNRVTVEGIKYLPKTRLGAKLVLGALGTRFIRGDADLNGTVELTDIIFTLSVLFLGGKSLPCLDAADANDVGEVDISDPIFLLKFLFIGGPPPPSPFPLPGEDMTPRASLGCERGI